MTTVELLTVCLSMLALAVSGGVALRQDLIGRRQLTLVYAQLAAEFRDREFVRAVHFVRDDLRNVVQDPAVRPKELPVEVQDPLGRVSVFFDQLGQLVAYRAVEEKLVLSLVGAWIDQTWRAVEPHVKAERQARLDEMARGAAISADYLVFYEDLVARVRARPPQQLTGRLGLRTVT
jgi:hypothetical protein